MGLYQLRVWKGAWCNLQTVNSKQDYLLIPVHNGNCKFEFTRGLSVTKFAKYIDPFESELDSIKYVAIESNKWKWLIISSQAQWKYDQHIVVVRNNVSKSYFVFEIFSGTNRVYLRCRGMVHESD